MYSSSDQCVSAVPRSRRRDLFELSGVFLLILSVIWTPRPWQWGLWLVAATCIITLCAMSFEGFRSMGLCILNLRRSLWVVPVTMGVALLAIYCAARLHTLHVPSSPWLFIRHYSVYAIWAGIQQLILQCFFLTRSLRLLPNASAAAALSASLFAVAHLPNPFLTLVTLFFGLGSCLFFLHYRNLWPLAIAHAILGICIAVTVPGPVDHNMRVGIGYLTYVDRTVLTQAVPAAAPAARPSPKP